MTILALILSLGAVVAATPTPDAAPVTVVATTTTAVSAAHPPLLVFDGNQVLNDQVYRALLDLPRTAKPTPKLARMLELRILDFLRRAGYELATVSVAVSGVKGQEHLAVTIDEGHLDKVLFLGEGAFQTLRLKLELSLPFAVFNRPELEKQLGELSARHGLVGVQWQLVPVEHVDHIGPQLESIATIQAVPILPPAHPYELHILIQSRDWDVGLAPDLRIDSAEGVGLGLHWRAASLLVPGDRFEVRTRAAVNLRSTIDENSTQVVLSRALAESRWFTPPLVGESLRSFFWLRADLLNRQRGDLGVESFFYVPFDASANLELEPIPELALSLGIGAEHRRLFALHLATTVPVSAVVEATPSHETRLFGLLAAALVLDPDEIRRDRRHELHLEARFFAEADLGSGSSVRLAYSYQKVFLFGWHELWLRTRGVWLGGEVLFPDEEGMGGAHLRGPFSGQYYARKLTSAGAEVRLSVARDLFKVGLFHDLAAFGRIDRTSNDTTLAVANAFGVGVHALFFDAFSADAYFGLGFASGGVFGNGFLLEIDQAF